jgi:hypothetical protein
MDWFITSPDLVELSKLQAYGIRVHWAVLLSTTNEILISRFLLGSPSPGPA